MTLHRSGVLVIWLVLPGQAAAHGGLPGGGGFYSGLAHPVLAIEQALVLLAFGLVLGQASGSFARLPLIVLAAALLAGLRDGVNVVQVAPVALALALGLGVVLAAAVNPPIWAISLSAGLVGWVVGTDTDVPAPVSGDLIKTYAPYAGVFLGVFLIALNAAALASVARWPAIGIGVRVLGAWIAAVALMVLALRVTQTGGV